MSEKKKTPKLTYAMSEPAAKRQMKSAEERRDRAEALIEFYCCSERDLKYTRQIVEVLAEYLTNARFYKSFMEEQLQTGERIKNKKTGEDNIMVDMDDFNVLNSYLVVTAACENELESYGISMQLH
tara:strand:+ start:2679 stop:3056 length:378 start_codon:yes stop_codon:yes gene_type:complete